MAQSKFFLFIFNICASVVRVLLVWYVQWTRIKQLLASRFVLGTDFYFRLESESLGSPCICEGSLYYFRQPRCSIGGNQNKRSEVKVLTTVLPTKWSAKSLSSEPGGVPTATYSETWNYFCMVRKSLKVNVQL